MKTKCTNCGKVYEAQGNKTGQGKCYNCALTGITCGRPPEIEDITTAYFVSGEMPNDEWHDFQAELRRYHPGDFYEEEPELCNNSNDYTCRCAEYEEVDRRREADDKLHEQEWETDQLYYEALEEDLDRKNAADQEAQQAKWDAVIAADEAQAVADEEYYDSFSYLWYKLVGWNNYNRFVAPILIGWLRFKKRWRH